MGQLPLFPEEIQQAGGVRITSLGLFFFFFFLMCCVFVAVHGLSSVYRLSSQRHMVLVALGHVGS